MRKSQDLLVSESVEEFIEVLSKQRFKTVSKRHGKRRTDYIDTVVTYDTETTNTPDDGFVYSHQICVGGKCCVVRYTEDIIAIFDWLADHYRTHEDRRLVVYVHNLGYEHFYMTQILASVWGEPENSLFTKPHKPLSIRYGNGIEFRDSLKLFQASLAQATKGCPHQKLVGDLDYSVYRTPDTPLTQEEFDYCVNDVIGLYEAIMRFRETHGDDQATIPYTNTGLVIRTVNNYIRDSKDRAKCKKTMENLELDRQQMEICYNAMAGGDTHGTRWRAGKTYENCNSYDLKSAHPSQMILRDYPTGRPMTISDCEEEEANDLIDAHMGWVAKVVLFSIKIKAECPDPTLSLSKTVYTDGEVQLDNGRVLSCDGCVAYMDSNDWQRFKEAYNYEGMYIVEGVMFELAPLPDGMRNAVLHYFTAKEHEVKDSAEYRLSKIVVNTIFGACAQKTVRDECLLELRETITINKTKWQDKLAEMDDDKVFKSQQSKFPFLWGLWTASMSRLALFKLIKAVGWDKAIYWDTDSCKFEGEKVPAVDAYNADVVELCKTRKAEVEDRDNQIVYIGTAEDEHPKQKYGYKRFRFLHAKCYAAETEDGIETTIAGVGKKQGAAAMRGNIDNLADGLFIADAGGNALTYNDRSVTKRTGWKRPTVSASYIYMEPRKYLLNTGITDTVPDDDFEIICG